MVYQIDAEEPLPEAAAKALSDYIEKYGPPPRWAESIEVKVVDGEVVIVEFFTLKET